MPLAHGGVGQIDEEAPRDLIERHTRPQPQDRVQLLAIHAPVLGVRLTLGAAAWRTLALGTTEGPAMRLQRATALVTGGGRGIGRHTAIALAREGCRVSVTARSEDELDATIDLIREGDGPEAIAIVGDVRSPEDVARTVSETERRLGPIDVLVNCAGLGPTPSLLAGADPDDWWRVMEVNVRGPMLYVSYVVPGMIERGRGCIINVNSLAGIDARTAGGGSAYGVSKAALFRLTDILATELEGTGVVAFDISPGLVRTAMTEGVPLFADIPEDQWTDIEIAAGGIVELATGRLDALTGRFVHATDDFEELAERADSIRAEDARILTLRTFGPDDPLNS